jgi:hypothetical protein
VYLSVLTAFLPIPSYAQSSGTTTTRSIESPTPSMPLPADAVQAPETPAESSKTPAPTQQPLSPESAPDIGTTVDEPQSVEPAPTSSGSAVPPAPASSETPAIPEAPPPFVDFKEPPMETPPATPATAGTDAVPADAPQAPHLPTRRQLCTRPEEGEDTMVDDMQETMEETTCAAALWLDGLFGEPRNLDTARRTSGFLETSVNWSEFKDWDERVRFRVRFKLPNLKNRVSAVFGRDNEDDVVRDRSEGFAVRSALPRVAEDDSWLAGLGYSFPGSKRFKTDFRVGVASVTKPRTYVQQRARYIAYSDEEDLFYIRGTVFWNNRVGAGVTTGADYSRVLTRTLLLRFTNVGTISQDSEGLDWFSGLILYQNLREERAMAYELLIRGQTDEPEPLYEYGGRVVYRHPLLKRRLYAELLVGYSWPRVDPDVKREGAAQAGLSIEMPFGERADD